MAKKKSDVVDEPDVPESFTQRILNQVEKDYGDGVMVSGEDVRDAKLTTVPWSPSLDAILGGGILEGSWVGITGPPKTCKTSVALCLAKNAQKPEYGSRPVFYAKIEGRLSMALLRGTADLDLSPTRFNVIQSSKRKLLAAQDYLTILSDIITAVPNAFIIIDSISALCDEREMTDGVGTETRGGGAKLFSQFCRLNNQKVPIQNTIVVGITHQIHNTSGIGPTKVERAAEMWKYQCDYQLRTVMKTPWKVGERSVGYQVKLECKTSRTGPPGLAIDSYVRFNLGIDDLFELMQFGMAMGSIKKSGAWLSLEFLREFPELLEDPEKVPQFQGGDKACEALRKNKEWGVCLANVVRRATIPMMNGEE